jgi:hypothetical protein
MFAALAAPTSALAKLTTRIVVSKSQVAVDWSAPGTAPVAPVITAKIQKKVGRKWVAMSTRVTVYYQGPDDDGFRVLGSPRGSSVRVTLAARGSYKIVCAATSKTKASVAYTKRVDAIGPVIGHTAPVYTSIDATWTRVTVSYDVGWNTEAFSALSVYPLLFSCEASFDTGSAGEYGGAVWIDQEMWEPGTVDFSWRVRTAYIQAAPVFNATATLSGDYVVTSAATTDIIPVP